NAFYEQHVRDARATTLCNLFLAAFTLSRLGGWFGLTLLSRRTDAFPDVYFGICMVLLSNEEVYVTRGDPGRRFALNTASGGGECRMSNVEWRRALGSLRERSRGGNVEGRRRVGFVSRNEAI